MRKLLRMLAVAMLGVSLTTGMAAAADADIDTTGPDSENEIVFEEEREVEVENENRVRVENNNPQSAHTGDARVRDNTEGGDADSGWATNQSVHKVRAYISNASATDLALQAGSGGSDHDARIYRTGPDSENEIKFENEYEVEVKNENDVEVTNNNSQTATTGDARVSHNTEGGDATSGDATNDSYTETVIEIHN